MINVSSLRKDMLGRRQTGHFFRDLFRSSITNRTILSNISFDVNAGERVALIGRNGSGKSTLMKLLTGIISPTSGTLRVNGIDPHRNRRRLMQSTGVLFAQKSYLYPNLTLNDCVRLYSAVRKLSSQQRKQHWERLDSFLNLAGFADQQVRTLSFGQRMRSELCCALLHDPPLVLLDEPTVGLDSLSRDFLFRLLHSKDMMTGKTIVMVSHDTEIISGFSERCIELDQGQVVFDGNTAHIVARQQVVYDLETSLGACIPSSISDKYPFQIEVQSPFRTSLTFPQGTIEMQIQACIADVLNKITVTSMFRRTITGAAPDGKS
jgi:ABC-2 type transport system ATP-binding protein